MCVRERQTETGYLSRDCRPLRQPGCDWGAGQRAKDRLIAPSTHPLVHWFDLSFPVLAKLKPRGIERENSSERDRERATEHSTMASAGDHPSQRHHQQHQYHHHQQQQHQQQQYDSSSTWNGTTGSPMTQYTMDDSTTTTNNNKGPGGKRKHHRRGGPNASSWASEASGDDNNSLTYSAASSCTGESTDSSFAEIMRVLDDNNAATTPDLLLQQQQRGKQKQGASNGNSNSNKGFNSGNTSEGSLGYSTDGDSQSQSQPPQQLLNGENFLQTISGYVGLCPAISRVNGTFCLWCDCMTWNGTVTMATVVIAYWQRNGLALSPSRHRDLPLFVRSFGRSFVCLFFPITYSQTPVVVIVPLLQPLVFTQPT